MLSNFTAKSGKHEPGSCFGRCRCISKSAKTLRSVSKLTKNFYNSRAGDTIHKSHTEAGITELNLGMRHLGAESTLPITACIQVSGVVTKEGGGGVK